MLRTVLRLAPISPDENASSILPTARVTYHSLFLSEQDQDQGEQNAEDDTCHHVEVKSEAVFLDPNIPGQSAEVGNSDFQDEGDPDEDEKSTNQDRNFSEVSRHPNQHLITCCVLKWIASMRSNFFSLARTLRRQGLPYLISRHLCAFASLRDVSSF